MLTLLTKSVAVLLLLWEPLNFSAEALAVLPTIAYRGWPAGMELAWHGLVAAVAAAAGLALLNASADGARLATIAIVLSVVRTAQTLYATALPHNVSPGQPPLILGVTLIVAIAAVVIVTRPARHLD